MSGYGSIDVGSGRLLRVTRDQSNEGVTFSLVVTMDAATFEATIEEHRFLAALSEDGQGYATDALTVERLGELVWIRIGSTAPTFSVRTTDIVNLVIGLEITSPTPREGRVSVDASSRFRVQAVRTAEAKWNVYVTEHLVTGDISQWFEAELTHEHLLLWIRGKMPVFFTGTLGQQSNRGQTFVVKPAGPISVIKSETIEIVAVTGALETLYRTRP